MKLCLCGCGQQIKDNQKYVFGHNRRKKEPWNKGKTGIYSDETIEKIRKTSLKENLSKETLKKMSDARIGKEPWNKGKKGVYSKKTLFLMSKKRKQTIENIKEKYSLFSKIEEMRYNPINKSEIQVHCKNHNCKNSKEQGGWFTPGKYQLYERIRQIESEYGQGGCYFYCSDQCKNECPLSYVRDDPLKDKINKQYTETEYQFFRKYILERDNYICQYCDKPAEHVHHERPQKLEPFHALDPDLAWSVCSKCHYKYGHKDECSTGKISLLKLKKC